jgi:hypothetical protein
MKRFTPTAYVFALSVLFLACGSDDSAAGNLGVAGASCQSSPQCEAPLQCIQNLCTALNEPDTITSDATELDLAEPVDTPIIPDAVVSDATPEDVPTEELPSQCEVLGIAPDWKGSFDGAIEFTVTDPPPGILDAGTLIVTGELTFSIHCLGQKLIVVGSLDGMGSAEGQDGENPFFADIAGLQSHQKYTDRPIERRCGQTHFFRSGDHRHLFRRHHDGRL